MHSICSIPSTSKNTKFASSAEFFWLLFGTTNISNCSSLSYFKICLKVFRGSCGSVSIDFFCKCGFDFLAFFRLSAHAPFTIYLNLTLKSVKSLFKKISKNVGYFFSVFTFLLFTLSIDYRR